MKNKQRGTAIVSALFAMLYLAQTASAFYAPNLQRWVNRDPVNDEFVIRQAESAKGLFAAAELKLEAMGNLYSFGHNSPPRYVDGDGRVAILIPAAAAGGVVVVIGQGVTIGAALCLVIPSCREALRKATEKAIEKCRPMPRNDRENCPLEDQHDMGPAAGYRCEYWCRKSGARPVIYVPHAEGGCPKSIEQ